MELLIKLIIVTRGVHPNELSGCLISHSVDTDWTEEEEKTEKSSARNVPFSSDAAS